MYLCSAIAIVGAAVTYVLTPRYGAAELAVGEDSYLALEHECLRPTPEDLASWETVRLQRSKSSQMLQVLEGVVDADNITGPSISAKGEREGDARSSGDDAATTTAQQMGAARRSVEETRSEREREREQDVEADVDEEGGLVVGTRFSYQKSFS